QVGENELTPEDFARDVMIESTGNSVENSKLAEDAKPKIQVLAGIQRILHQDAATKDAFREFDGFLIVMSLLSNVRNRSNSLLDEPSDDRSQACCKRIPAPVYIYQGYKNGITKNNESR
ncbi:hypothetical protein E4T56_gene842, partial [Termitomyces sp. T112]